RRGIVSLMRQIRLRLFFALAAVTAAALVLLMLGGGGAPAAGASAANSPSAALALQAAIVQVVRTVSPSVVQIEDSTGLGSGIVFDSAGDIVTNAHVVAGARSFAVTTSTGKGFRARLVGRFTPDDLAVIRLAGAHLRPARFADSSRLQVGDIAIAIGNPLGLRSSVTDGII